MCSGVVDVVADEPHSDLVYWLLKKPEKTQLTKLLKLLKCLI
jgi:hypothetical protein